MCFVDGGGARTKHIRGSSGEFKTELLDDGEVSESCSSFSESAKEEALSYPLRMTNC